MANLQMVQQLILPLRELVIANMDKREETVPQIGGTLSLGLVSMKFGGIGLADVKGRFQHKKGRL